MTTLLVFAQIPGFRALQDLLPIGAQVLIIPGHQREWMVFFLPNLTGVREGLEPPETIEGLSDQEVFNATWKTEYDMVVVALEHLGHLGLRTMPPAGRGSTRE